MGGVYDIAETKTRNIGGVVHVNIAIHADVLECLYAFGDIFFGGPSVRRQQKQAFSGQKMQKLSE